jgi:catechol 2,3-dioxygenase-like lactoylglutathione lyase family enzyme
MIAITCVTFDCADPEVVAAFWAAALRWDIVGHTVRPPGGIGPYLECVPVPESKTSKNRIHVGLSADDLDAEIARLESLGASFAWEEDFPEHWGYRNVVLRDPEGNEFCLGTSKSAHARAVSERAKSAVEDPKLLEALDVLSFQAGF